MEIFLLHTLNVKLYVVLYPSDTAALECNRNCASILALLLGFLEEQMHNDNYAMHLFFDVNVAIVCFVGSFTFLIHV